jgi:capsule polysaccharide export protein KpsE/RkpR
LKFETVFKSVILTQQEATALAKQSIAELQQRLESLEGKLTEERSLNEKKSARVQELEKKIGTIEKALKWMRKQSA